MGIYYFLYNIEYLISLDYDGKIIITDITDDYKQKFEIKINIYGNDQITCCLMIFIIYNKEKLDIKSGLVLISNKNNFKRRKITYKIYMFYVIKVNFYIIHIWLYLH